MSEVTWEITSLSELGTFSRGKSKHRPRNDIKLFEGGTYPLVQTGDVPAAIKNKEIISEKTIFIPEQHFLSKRIGRTRVLPKIFNYTDFLPFPLLL